MDEEDNNKQTEARRVLDAIRLKEDLEPENNSSIPKPAHWLVSEDAAQLQALVEQSRGIKQPPEELPKEPLPDPENIDPISVEQIKVMRKKNATLKTASPAIQSQHIYESIIRAYFEIMDYFKPSTKAKRCLTDGHQCLHCGEKFKATPPPSPPPTAEAEVDPGGAPRRA